MTAAPKRRWFQFSLRGLWLAVTLAAILSAIFGRSFYLHRMAVFHDDEKDRQIAEWRQEYESFGKGLNSAASEARKRELYFHHRTLANQYRKAIYRPWTAVNEVQPADST